MGLREDIDRVAAEADFSGVVRVERDGVVELDLAYGLADRAHGIAGTVDTRFAVASGAKGFTALDGDAARRGRPARPSTHRRATCSVPTSR